MKRQAGLGYTLALAAVAAGGGAVAYHLRDLTLATAAAVVAVYVLHLVGLRRLRGELRKARARERLAAELDGTLAEQTLVSRRFGLGAVALVEGAMGPAEVLRAMVASQGPGAPSFARYALEKGYLSEARLRTLLETRKEGRFLADQVRLARRKVREHEAG